MRCSIGMVPLPILGISYVNITGIGISIVPIHIYILVSIWMSDQYQYW